MRTPDAGTARRPVTVERADFGLIEADPLVESLIGKPRRDPIWDSKNSVRAPSAQKEPAHASDRQDVNLLDRLEELREQVGALDLNYIPHKDFSRKRSRDVILGPTPDSDGKSRHRRAPAGTAPELAHLYDVPLLTAEQEAHLFKKMNLKLHLASKLLGKRGLKIASPEKLEEVLSLRGEAEEIRNEIVQRNLRLVVSIAKKYSMNSGHLFELVSEGNMALIRATQKFDVGRGFRFSTCATTFITNELRKWFTVSNRHSSRFSTGHEEDLGVEPSGERINELQANIAQEKRERVVEALTKILDRRELAVVKARYLHDTIDGKKAATLKDLGKKLGVSKERVRQVEKEAITKMRILAASYPELEDLM